MKMLSHKPDQRLTLAQVRNNPWVMKDPIPSEELIQFLNDKQIEHSED